ncbi:MAG: IS1 family transposase [Chitinophagales bacterium]|nr:IS1 family transposase [Chitinophagales bacterium]
MATLMTSCIRLTDTQKCPYCSSKSLIKNGKTKTGKQKFYCKSCGKYLLNFYTYKAYDPYLSHNVCALIKEGCGVRNIARLLIPNRIFLSSFLTKKIQGRHYIL